MCLSKLFSATSVALRQVKPIISRPSPQKQELVLRAPARQFFGRIPETQYDKNNEITKKFTPGYALTHHWEIIPLFICVVIDAIVVAAGTYASLTQKLDVQWKPGSNWDCMSRHMDLRYPTIHKALVFYQRYEPWPEMQDAIDKMEAAENKRKLKAEACP